MGVNTRGDSGAEVVMVDVDRSMAEMEGGLTLSRDIRRACQLLEKLQKSKYCGEVPATKLAALQKVLQSEFLNAVREVYEHVYETVDVEGSPDIRASATAKATVAAFAAAEGHAHPRVVELPKTEEGLGFNVMGGRDVRRLLRWEESCSLLSPGGFYSDVLDLPASWLREELRRVQESRH